MEGGWEGSRRRVEGRVGGWVGDGREMGRDEGWLASWVQGMWVGVGGWAGKEGERREEKGGRGIWARVAWVLLFCLFMFDLKRHPPCAVHYCTFFPF